VPELTSASGTGAARPADGVEQVALSPGAIWVQGDAAEVSRDSRQFGPVAPDAVVGRAYRCYAPPDRRKDL
jgi:type IV secretory pathway protease TraF